MVFDLIMTLEYMGICQDFLVLAFIPFPPLSGLHIGNDDLEAGSALSPIIRGLEQKKSLSLSVGTMLERLK